MRLSQVGSGAGKLTRAATALVDQRSRQLLDWQTKAQLIRVRPLSLIGNAECKNLTSRQQRTSLICSTVPDDNHSTWSRSVAKRVKPSPCQPLSSMDTGGTLATPDVLSGDDNRWPNVIIPYPESWARKKAVMREGGAELLQVIADFDLTLTKFMVNGRRGQSCHALVSQGEEFDAKRHALYEHYFPLEHDPHIPYKEKFKLMEEWWSKSHALLLQGGLNVSDIRTSVEKANIAFRDNTAHLFEALDKRKVPVLIFSAGLADIIEEVLRQKLHRAFGNIRVVSNRMNFDEKGNLTGFQGRIIHVLNKNEHALEMAAPLHDDEGQDIDDLQTGAGEAVVAGRTNVILLGDHIGDLGMSEGVAYTERISVGFLNDQVEKNLPLYKESFDVIILGDGPMNFVVDLVQDILI